MVTTEFLLADTTMEIFLGQISIAIVRGGRAGYPAWRDNNDSSDSQDPPQV